MCGKGGGDGSSSTPMKENKEFGNENEAPLDNVSHFLKTPGTGKQGGIYN